MEEIKKESSNYLFGDLFGGLMQKTSIRFQIESMMAGLFMVMLGLVATCVYIIFYSNFDLFFKIMTAINTFFGVLILYSTLVGTFQGYKAMQEAQKIQDLIGSAMSTDINTELKGGNAKNGEKL